MVDIERGTAQLWDGAQSLSSSQGLCGRRREHTVTAQHTCRLATTQEKRAAQEILKMLESSQFLCQNANSIRPRTFRFEECSDDFSDLKNDQRSGTCLGLVCGTKSAPRTGDQTKPGSPLMQNYKRGRKIGQFRSKVQHHLCTGKVTT